MTELIVVDTNVAMAANRRQKAATACYEACRAAILEVLEDRKRLAIDDGWRIVREYTRNLRPTGQPDLGDAFLKWVLTNHAGSKVERVSITPKEEDDLDFHEFPDAAGLEKFDRSDRKFVAVANAHNEKPTILEGVDSKWWGWREALEAAGIRVEFLCRAEVEETYARKFPRQLRSKEGPSA